MTTDQAAASHHRPEVCPFAVDASELAKLMSLGLRTIRSMDAAGKLPKAFRCGARKLWSVDEIRAWIKAGAPERATWETLKAAGR